MFPSRFDYVAPDTVEEVLATLAQHGDEAKILAGGQSLIPLMKLRFASPGLLVDVNRVPGLGFVEETGEHLRVGTLTRNTELERSALLKSGYPVMADAAPMISDPLVRNRGTIGGSLAHADPAGDWGSVMLALGAEVVIKSSTDERTIPVSELLVNTFTTSLDPTEMITEIRVPKTPARSGGSYLKMERRVGDFATVATAVHLTLDNGTIKRAGIGLTAVGPKNLQASAAEDALAGAEPTAEAFEEAARLAAEASSPSSDVRGSAEYKKAMVRTFVRRGLDKALELARG